MSTSRAPSATAWAVSAALASGVWLPKGKPMTQQGFTPLPASSSATNLM